MHIGWSAYPALMFAMVLPASMLRESTADETAVAETNKEIIAKQTKAGRAAIAIDCKLNSGMMLKMITH